MKLWLFSAVVFSYSVLASSKATNTTDGARAVLQEQVTVQAAQESGLRPQLQVGTGLTTAIIGAQPGLHVSLDVPLNTSGIFAGLETGTYLFTTPELGTYIPILASISTRFDFSNQAYLMLGLAPGIGLVSFNNSKNPGGRDHSDVYFSMLIKPAFHLAVGDDGFVVFSPRVGTLNGNLLFSPMIGTTFEL